MTVATPGRSARKVDRPAALMPLISICLSELRRDFARVMDSKWAEAPRRRAATLISVIEEACDRQGLEALALLARSMLNLIGLSPEEAIPLGSALPEKLEELLKRAERVVSGESKRQTA